MDAIKKQEEIIELVKQVPNEGLDKLYDIVLRYIKLLQGNIEYKEPEKQIIYTGKSPYQAMWDEENSSIDSSEIPTKFHYDQDRFPPFDPLKFTAWSRRTRK